MAKCKPPPSKQLIRARRHRRQRLLSLKKVAGISQPKFSLGHTAQRKQHVEVLYFPSTLPPVPVSPKQEAKFTETRRSSNSGLTSITLFSLSPKSSSSHSQLSDELIDNTTAESSNHQSITPDLIVTPSTHSCSLFPRNGFSKNRHSSLETISVRIKEEPTSDPRGSISDVVHGRRVVDLGSILEKFEKIAQHPLQCPKGRMIALSEDVDILRSTIRFLCYECGQEATLESDTYVVF